jgi:hypothetical protein
MTSSYASSPLPKIVLIHGLNNNVECFRPLQRSLTQAGHECVLVTLPGHGDNRFEAQDLATARQLFRQQMTSVITGPWVAVAFSTGALYLQLLMQESDIPRPLGQVLLAPAFFIRGSRAIRLMEKVLPRSFHLKSWSPRPIRRYAGLHIWEYRLLFEAVETYQRLSEHFAGPTLIIIDPKDELVNARELRRHYPQQVLLIERPHLWKPGHHHIIFHPDYYRDEGWKDFVRHIQGFLSKLS